MTAVANKVAVLAGGVGLERTAAFFAFQSFGLIEVVQFLAANQATGSVLAHRVYPLPKHLEAAYSRPVFLPSGQDYYKEKAPSRQGLTAQLS